MKLLLMKKFIIPTLFLSIFCLESNSSHGQELIFASAHFPPWVVVDEEEVGGVDVEIIKEVAQRLGIKLVILDCPWKRCLRMMQDGQIDIMSSLFKRPDREQFMHFIEPPYLEESTTVFYVTKGNQHILNKYSDLYKLEVGITRGVSYFPKFDNDTQIKKTELVKAPQLLNMLVEKRIDTVPAEESYFDYTLVMEGFSEQIEKTKLKVTNKKEKTYFALSKKSSFVEQLPQLQDTLDEIVKEGLIQSIYNNYLERLRTQIKK